MLILALPVDESGKISDQPGGRKKDVMYFFTLMFVVM